MNSYNTISRVAILIIFSLSSIAMSQSMTTYNSGIILWGAFDREIGDIQGEMDKFAEIIELKKIDLDYFIYAKDTEGTNFRIKFIKINDDPDLDNKYIDGDGTEYLLTVKSKIISILSLKPIPNNDNIHMMLLIRVER